jgi:hypothetical protein
VYKIRATSLPECCRRHRKKPLYERGLLEMTSSLKPEALFSSFNGGFGFSTPSGYVRMCPLHPLAVTVLR